MAVLILVSHHRGCMSLVLEAISLLIVGCAAIQDKKNGTIPNILTFPSIVIGLICTFVFQGINEGVERGILLVVLFFIGGFYIMGMGDLKLLMAIGAMNGTVCLIVTVGFAALILLVKELICHPGETWIDIKAGVRSLLTLQFDESYGTGRKVSFAPYIFLGLLGGVIICRG